MKTGAAKSIKLNLDNRIKIIHHMMLKMTIYGNYNNVI